MKYNILNLLTFDILNLIREMTRPPLPSPRNQLSYLLEIL